jgi:hypothetical protein
MAHPVAFELAAASLDPGFKGFAMPTHEGTEADRLRNPPGVHKANNVTRRTAQQLRDGLNVDERGHVAAHTFWRSIHSELRPVSWHSQAMPVTASKPASIQGECRRKCKKSGIPVFSRPRIREDYFGATKAQLLRA